MTSSSDYSTDSGASQEQATGGVTGGAANASIVLAGGGTAGHVNPLLATARALRELDPTAKIVAVGTSTGLETELVPAAGFELELISRVPLPRRPNVAALKFPFEFRRALREAREVLVSRRATAVVGFGGYVSPPIFLAAKRAGVPVIVHEGNALPGFANRLGARFAKLVALTFRTTPLRAKDGETLVTGLPLKPEVVKLATARADASRRTQAAMRFSLDPARPVLLVTGGSLGAVHLNETVASVAREIVDAGWQVLHLTGKGKAEGVRTLLPAGIEGYSVLEYLAQMEDAYAVADAVITRSGAGMVCEVAALGIPAVFVPLPIGNGEQARNAADVVAAGGALLCADADFTPHYLRSTVLPLLNDADRLAQMQSAARESSPLDAAQVLARHALALRPTPEEGIAR